MCLGAHGLAREDERRFALRVLEGILGGTSSSRLFQEVRERRGLAYSIFSFSNLYSHAGEVGLYVGTRPDNLREALAVVAAELERLVEDPASEEELVRSRENLKGRVVLGMESTGARMSRLGSSLLHGMPILVVNEMLARIDAVGLERPARAGRASCSRPSACRWSGSGPSASACSRRWSRWRSARARRERPGPGEGERPRMIRVVVSGAGGTHGQDRLRRRHGRPRHGARRARRPAARDEPRRSCSARPTWWSTSPPPTWRSRTRSRACAPASTW